MKKIILTGLIVTVLTVLAASGAMASSFNVGLDYLATADNNQNEDYSGYGISGEYKSDSFKVGLDYWKYSYENDGADNDENFMTVKFGYKLTDGIYATLSYFEDSYSWGKTQAYLVGIDASFPLTDKMSLDGNLGYSVSGSDSEYDGDIIVYTYGLKLNYQITEQVGVDLKYQFLCEDYSDVGTWVWKTGFVSIGVNFMF